MIPSSGGSSIRNTLLYIDKYKNIMIEGTGSIYRFEGTGIHLELKKSSRGSVPLLPQFGPAFIPLLPFLHSGFHSYSLLYPFYS